MAGPATCSRCRRASSTSAASARPRNICTSQQLIGLAATVYLATVGQQGLRQRRGGVLPQGALRRGADRRARRVLASTTTKPFFKEFVVRCPQPPAEINAALLERGIIGGLDVSDQVDNGMLLCVTEMNTRDEIERLVGRAGERSARRVTTASRPPHRSERPPIPALACTLRPQPAAAARRHPAGARRAGGSAAAGAVPARRPAPAGDVAERGRAATSLGSQPAELQHRHRLLPARLLHDEVQPEGQRGRRRACPASPTRIPMQPAETVAGGARRPARAAGDRSPRSPAWTPSASRPPPARRANSAGS